MNFPRCNFLINTRFAMFKRVLLGSKASCSGSWPGPARPPLPLSGPNSTRPRRWSPQTTTRGHAAIAAAAASEWAPPPLQCRACGTAEVRVVLVRCRIMCLCVTCRIWAWSRALFAPWNDFRPEPVLINNLSLR